MRKGAFILLAVLIVMVAILTFFLQDRYLERAIESAGETVVGAKVEVDNFDFDFIGLQCSWEHLQVANPNHPWHNLVETGKASFAIEGRPLFWGRIIINEMVLEDVRSGSRRETDGALPIKPGESTEPDLFKNVTKTVDKRIRELSEIDFSSITKTLKIDSLVDLNKLISVNRYNRLRQNIDSTFGNWDTQIKQQDYDKQIQEIQTDIVALKPDSVKNDVVVMAKMLQKLDKIYQRIAALKNDIEAKQKDLTTGMVAIRNGLKQIQNALQADIDMAKRRAKLQGLEMKDVAMVLFGEPVVARIEQILHSIAVGRKYLPAAEALLTSNEPQNPPRFEGQNIYFPFRHRYPRLLIRKIRLSGMTAAGDTSRGYALEGDVFGLTNEPPVYGQPTRVALKFFHEAGNHYTIRGIFDHAGDIAKDSLWISADNIRLGEYKLPASKYFPQSFIAERGGIHFTGFFIGDAINLKLSFQAKPVVFQFALTAKDKVERIIRDVLSNTNKIDLDAVIKGMQGDYALSMNSNLDNALSTGVMGALSSNLRESQVQLERRVRHEAGKSRAEVEARIDRYNQTTLAEVNHIQKRIQTEFDKIEKYKKDLEARIETEKKKAGIRIAGEKTKLEEKAKKGLESLFKKKKN